MRLAAESLPAFCEQNWSERQWSKGVIQRYLLQVWAWVFSCTDILEGDISYSVAVVRIQQLSGWLFYSLSAPQISQSPFPTASDNPFTHWEIRSNCGKFSRHSRSELIMPLHLHACVTLSVMLQWLRQATPAFPQSPELQETYSNPLSQRFPIFISWFPWECTMSSFVFNK